MDVADKGPQHLSLAALQKLDPHINKLLDVGQVALYNVIKKAKELEKSEIQGTLFVYTGSASPHHGFSTIMDRLGPEDLARPINKDLELQLCGPLLLHRNGNMGIYCIWFYDKRHCQRIAQLMINIIKHEADHAQRESSERVAPTRTTKYITEPHSIVSLEVPKKANEEYCAPNTDEIELSVTAENTVNPAVETTAHVYSTSQSKDITVEEEELARSLPHSSPLIPIHNTTTTTPSQRSGLKYKMEEAPRRLSLAIALRHLQRLDPLINKLLDVSGQVTAYNFNKKANEWENAEIQGTLLVYTRSVPPYHGFTIMNRLSPENLVLPINRDLGVQLQESSFLLIKNADLDIYCIWFYEKRDCQRIAQLMTTLVKKEANFAQRQPVKERVRVATEHIVKPAMIGARERARGTPQPQKKPHAAVKQITVEELFSIPPKDPVPAMPVHNTVIPSHPSSAYPHSHSYPPPPALDPHLPHHQTASPWCRPAPTSHQSSACSSFVRPTAPVFGVSSPGAPGWAQPTSWSHRGTAKSTADMGQEVLNMIQPSVKPHKPARVPNPLLPRAMVLPQIFQKPMLNHIRKEGKDTNVFSQHAPGMFKPTHGVDMNTGLAFPHAGPAGLLGVRERLTCSSPQQQWNYPLWQMHQQH